MDDVEKIKLRTLRRIEHSHVFSPALASLYGLECAIVLAGMRFWIGANRAEGRHLHEGHTWAYFSRRAMCETWPYLTENVIRQRVSTLVEEGVLLKAQLGGIFNNQPHDRTNWFAFADETLFFDTIIEK